MTSETDKELLLRVADSMDAYLAADRDTQYVPAEFIFSDAEARTISRVLREAAEGGWRPIEMEPLQWERELGPYGALVARPGFGRRYYVVPLDDGFIVGGRPKPVYPTEAAAQEAAQAIHNTHIRSALRALPRARHP